MSQAVTPVQDWTPALASRLTDLEAVISRGIQTFVDVGNALKEIRDSRLYRVQFGTFEAYCRERWGFVRRYTDYLIQSAEVVHELRENNCSQLPATESQARELSRIKDPERRAEVWREVTETHAVQDITAKVIREAAEGAVFTCICGEEFNVEVWHCSVCAHHWTMDRDECRNCESAGRISKRPAENESEPEEDNTAGYNVFSDALRWATIAISQLERIRKDDPRRMEALNEVGEWVEREKRQ